MREFEVKKRAPERAPWCGVLDGGTTRKLGAVDVPESRDKMPRCRGVVDRLTRRLSTRAA